MKFFHNFSLINLPNLNYSRKLIPGNPKSHSHRSRKLRSRTRSLVWNARYWIKRWKWFYQKIKSAYWRNASLWRQRNWWSLHWRTSYQRRFSCSPISNPEKHRLNLPERNRIQRGFFNSRQFPSKWPSTRIIKFFCNHFEIKFTNHSINLYELWKFIPRVNMRHFVIKKLL